MLPVTIIKTKYIYIFDVRSRNMPVLFYTSNFADDVDIHNCTRGHAWSSTICSNDGKCAQ